MIKVNSLADLKRYVEELDSLDNNVIPVKLDLVLSVPEGLMEGDESRIEEIGKGIIDIFKEGAKITSAEYLKEKPFDSLDVLLGTYGDERFKRIEYHLDANVVGAKGTNSENMNIEHLESGLEYYIPRILTQRFEDGLQRMNNDEYKEYERKIYIVSIKASK